ncbi:MAG TPA: chemotaxis protein CheB [Vicinamibacterales bacterium]|nr:chemotaxis protein CheB [Vicinamibacterales bacterium]
MPLTIVGIGASAGGLEAVTELLGALPATTGMAYIVVQHLDPRHDSLLAEILAKKTAIPVSVAVSGETVQPDHVYVIPPDVTLTVLAGRIALSPRPNAPERFLPVDALFKSLADASGDHAIAVVVSGGDSDGSSGIQAVRQAGGLTLAQSPETARFPDMPRHAIETGSVDLVLRPNEIAHALVHLQQRLSAAAAPGPANRVDRGIDADEASLRHIFHRLRAMHGVDFTHYKRTTIRRRLERRLALRRIDGLDEYRRLIDDDPGELAALYQDCLIRVTEFFRDPESFDALRRYVFPVVCEGLSGKRLLRLWVPGCASGEEVYSLGIALLEYFGESVPSARIQIFGTDVSETALQHARAGVYSASVVDTVSSERRQRFFTRQNGEYRVVKDIRDLCLFARQDVTHDPPFSRLDLISCRNLLIYLDGVAQQRVLRTFHYALRPEGMLVFGPAESIGPSSDLFEQVDKRFRVYRRLPGHHGGSDLSHLQASDASTPTSRIATPDVDAESLLREADRLLLARFAPASLVVNQGLTILQYRGQTGPYLEPAGGVPSFDLRRVIRPELLVRISPAIQEASSTGAPSHHEVRMEDGRKVSIEIIPLKGSPDARAFLILFDDGGRHPSSAEAPAATAALPESEKDRRLAELERDIAGLRAYLRAAIEEHGAIEEELKSAHEEVLSANEEFQSTNEELETSKEELQSTNEELTSTIDELRHRNQELAAVNAELDETRRATERARAYADVIIDTVRQPLAVVNSAQRILRVNAAFSHDLDVPREKAEGQLLHDIDDGRWNIPELRQRRRDVVSGGQALEDHEVTVDLGRHGRRVMSLNASRLPGDAERAELLLLAFNDVTVRAGITADLVATNQRKDEFLAMLGHELRHPLTPITHAIYLLRRGIPEPANAELLDTIDTHTQTLLRFVNDLLDVARIGRGLIEVRRDPVDLGSVIREAAQVVEPLIHARQHKLSVTLPADPVSVNGDAGRLKQVITNLLENAAKFTEPGGQITITVTLEPRDGRVLLRVRDTGIGIAREDLERVFEPFTQANAGLTGSSGLGLGLSVARRVIELHGGQIEATSGGLTTGSEFVVRLPLLVSDETGDQPAGPMRTLPAPIALHPRKVLIVDDHDEVRRSLVRVVRTFGHEVADAKDGPGALALAERFQPDCVILDLSMAGMNGIELGRRLRKLFPRERLTMIALTGFTGRDLREECLAAGFDEHLTKPGDILKLEQLLRGEGLDPYD